MAEVVHRNLESMLPELEELERSGIFSHEEIRCTYISCCLYSFIAQTTVCGSIDGVLGYVSITHGHWESVHCMPYSLWILVPPRDFDAPREYSIPHKIFIKS